MVFEVGMRVEHWDEIYNDRPLEGYVVEDPDHPDFVSVEWDNGDIGQYQANEAESIFCECRCGICMQRESQCKCAEWNRR